MCVMNSRVQDLKKSVITSLWVYDYSITDQKLHIRAIPETRERIDDEIIPETAEQSKTYEENELQFPARHAIDLNWSTLSGTSAGPDGKSWLKINLSQVHCVQQVKARFNGRRTPDLTWTCAQTDCNACSGPCATGCFCNRFTVTVSSEGTAPNNPMPGCKYGDSVMVERKHGGFLGVYEIAITGRQGK